MRLNDKALQDVKAWEAACINLPRFDRKAVVDATEAAPVWVHFGAGNIFRAFLAMSMQKLLDEGLESRGIVAVGGEIIDKIFIPHDNLTLLVTLKANGTIEKTVVGSIVKSLKTDSDDTENWQKLSDVFANESLQMVSFTITEKGYALRGADGGILPDVARDFSAGFSRPQSYMGKLAALLYVRYLAGGRPIAMVSMDNCSQNGTRLHTAIAAFAEKWAERGLIDKGFLDYVNDPGRVSFPWSMIDKITPRPDESVAAMLRAGGFEDTDVVTTSKNSFAAPFVNAEEAQYLVIEDAFPNGRPMLEKAGVLFTERSVVGKVEKMKVGTCLNPLHTALAVFGCLLGYTKISDEMKDEQLVKLVERIGYKEGLPVVVDPGIINPKDFIDEVLNVRFPNPFMPDTPQRIACDTSQKIPIRFGETLKAYIEKDMDVTSLRAIPLVLAAWCRYLLGVDDEGNAFTPSPDPLLETLQSQLAGITLGNTEGCRDRLRPILSNPTYVGVDLYKVGLGELVEDLFVEMASGPGAVRKALSDVVNG